MTHNNLTFIRTNTLHTLNNIGQVGYDDPFGWLLCFSPIGITSKSISLFSGDSPPTLHSTSDSPLWRRSGKFSVRSVLLSFGLLDSFSKQWKLINFRGNMPAYSPISKQDIRKRKHVFVQTQFYHVLSYK